VKYGIFSDIHGNLEALEAVLLLLRREGATRFICLGDLVGYGADPNACVEAVRQLKARVVAGNHDLGAIQRVAISRFNSAAQQALFWTREQLTRNNRLYLENLPLTDTLEPLHLVHASPSAPDRWEYIFTVREAEDEIGSFTESACLVGHSHYPFAVECPNGSPCRLIRPDAVRLDPAAKYVINAGSVGQPRDGDPRACCLLYDVGAATLTYHRVTYDVGTAQQKIRAAGLPEYLASRLGSGR
jgi:diadenosine tetraphosphatase ApaH/serine/threonine PP2A family protein phosphatase